MSDKKNINTNFETNYSDGEFWTKIKNYARTAGESVLEPALKMYYVAQDDETPLWAKSTVYGALGYFISPIDAIPDIMPVVGYSDDLGVLVLALATVATHVKKVHEEKAKGTLEQWFGKTED